MNIGQAISEIRKKKGITQKELAKECGLSVTAIVNIEKGKCFPSKTSISSICQSLGVAVSVLMVYSITEEDVPEDRRDSFRVIIEPIKAYLTDAQF